MIKLLSTIWMARKKGLLFLKKASGPVRLDCIGGACGLCCEVLGSGVVVADSEAVAIGPANFVDRNNVRVMRSNGDVCALLKNKTCSCYDVRPKGCREYPWYNVDGELYYDSGCPGMKFDRDEQPNAADIRPIESYLPGFLKNMMKNWLVK